ncbi:MAG TPA: sulfurtransferase, partial [Brevibacterium sp.]|nr:sulfurtransferase [Brevibacterium sp.]
MTAARRRVLVTVDELAQLLDADGVGDRPVVLDVRWTLQQPDGREEFAAGHIPGARYVALDTELSAHTSAEPTQGRHPLPSAEQFEATVRSWGVRTGTPVVVYDDVAGQAAARAWWLLRWAGHSEVRVLDGGWSAWRAAGLPEEPGAGGAAANSAAAGTSGADGASSAGGAFVIRPGSMPSLSADEAAELARSEDGVLLDARAAERFEGRTEPLDPVAGHIPGALNAPAGGNAEDGRFRSADSLMDYYSALGAMSPRGANTSAAQATDTTPPATATTTGPATAPSPALSPSSASSPSPMIGAYCGSGVSASHTVLALASIGVDAALFPGSWSAWSNDPARPAATGTADAEEVHPPRA